MKLVIDIPEKVNNRIRSTLGHGYCIRTEDVQVISKAVYNAQPVVTWNPVNKYLPDKEGVYLITTNKGNVYLWTYKPEMEKIWYRFVTAWCYLPEPYEE